MFDVALPLSENLGSALGPIVIIIGAATLFGARAFWRRFGPIPDYRRKYVEEYGYILPKRWQVHHIDKNRRNNKRSNLVALPYGLHRIYHLNDYALGKIDFLIRGGYEGEFKRAKVHAEELLDAAEFIGLCYKYRDNEKKLRRIDELFAGRNDSLPEIDRRQL